MQPSDEALAWQQRADAWATQAESPQDQAVEPASRWSDTPATTGRPTYPSDGVGWRTETAEWRATGGARWKQTTEWRSTTGSHGWRSTTEAWQNSGNRSYPPAAETPMSQPAISSTPWTPTESANQPAADSRPAWQQFTDTSSEPWRADSWQSSQETPTWSAQESQPWQTQEPASWQQPAPRPPIESSSSWQQLVEPTSSTTPSWRSNAIEGTATWNDTPATNRGWGRDESTETPSWQTPRPEDARHLVREDDRAAWRRGAEMDPGDSSPRIGRRRAPENPAGGTGWSGRSDAADWAGYTDTGNISLYPEPAAEAPSWGGGRYSADPVSAPAEPIGRRALPAAPYEEPTEPGRRRRREDPPQAPYAETPRPRRADEMQGAAQTAYPAGRRGRYAEETPAPEVAAPMPQRGGRRRAEAEQEPTDRRAFAQPEPTDRRAFAQQSPAAPAPENPGPPKGRARYNQVQDDWREHTGSWAAEPDTSNWMRDPDTGQWSRSDDDPRVLAWRAEAARREAMAEPSKGRLELPAAPSSAPAGTRGGAAFGSAPASAMPYGGSPATPRRALPSAPRSATPDYEAPAPRSAMPADAPYNGGGNPYDTGGGIPDGRRGAPYSDAPGPALRSAMPDRSNRGNPYDSGFGTAPTSAIADGGRRGGSYGEQPPQAPRSAPPDGGRRNGVNPYDDGRGALPESRGRAPYAETPRGADSPGPAPRSALPYRGEPGPAQRSALPYRGEPGPAQRSALPYGGAGDPGSAQPYGSGPGSAQPYGREPSSARSFGNEPSSALPYRGEPGSAQPYGREPDPSRGDTTYGGGATAPRSATPYGGGYGSVAPRSAPGYGTAAPRSGIPGTGTNGARATPYGSDDPYRAGGRRRATDNDDLPGGRAPTTDSWRRDPEPTDDRRARRQGPPTGAGQPPSWSSGGEQPSWSSSGEQPSWSSGSEPPSRSPGGDTPSWSRDDRPGIGRRGDDTTRGGWDNDLGRQNGRAGDWRAQLDPGPPPAADPAATEPWNADPNGWQQKPAWQREDDSRGYGDAGQEDDWRRDLADRSNLADGESRRYGTSDYVPFRSSGSAAAPRNLSTTGTSLNSPVPREQREAQARPPRTSNGYQGLSGSYERRAMSGGFPMSRRSNLLDPDDEEGEPESGGLLAAVGYTVIWYGVPVVLFLAYMLVTGSQSQATSTLGKAAPQFGVSLVLSILIAVGIRRVSDSWKAISVGLAAAVVGGGLATVLFSAITGNSLS
ncbi:hypothetical protein HH310_24995 [Actinoplanes sp. TBRC 11911]|uniref:hypothetical protein n=1 Tax=Actinoplanes sp. TBRC 11911 TaxID=2729386 RepID=UPI00145D4F3E|nr:hypothetical protein [Actinoplanes sp. TBRC 11911]NMO54428.1 hypothetical protein [Actinoplanes sp. TBRC 11911]